MRLLVVCDDGNLLYVPYHSTSYAKHNPITDSCIAFNELDLVIDFNKCRADIKKDILNLL